MGILQIKVQYEIKQKNADGSLNYAKPIRPKVTKGFR